MSIIRQTQIMEESYNSKTKSINVITEVENEIVNENVFFTYALLSMDTADVVDFGVITPDDMDIRLSEAFISADANYASLEIYEDVTFTGSTEYDYYNSNRQSSNAGTLTIYSAFSVAPDITGATRIQYFATLGGTTVGQTSIGGSQSGSEFIVLKRDTKYLFRITNHDGDGVTVLAKEAWIETDLTD